MEVTKRTFCSPLLMQSRRVLVLSDLHQQPKDDYLPLWCSLQPDLVWIVGDFLELGDHGSRMKQDTLALLRALADRFPIYYSLGNHECGALGNKRPRGIGATSMPVTATQQRMIDDLATTGVQVLHNEWIQLEDICLGGLTSAADGWLPFDFLEQLAARRGCRVLLCHHPEYYEPYLKRYSFDLTVSGHAHGGQWRLLSRGVYSPGQGLFPRFTDGFYDGGRLLVSRGLGGKRAIPRFGNPKQTVLLQLVPQQQNDGEEG